MYDVFLSYSRSDNQRGQVTALKAKIESSFREFAERDLRVFFDAQEIGGMDDWRQKIQRSLRDSLVFVALLSPAYLASRYCRWEWEDYVRYEANRQCLGDGVAPVFFVTLPDTADPKSDEAIASWIDEILRRQTFDLRPWYHAGEQALQQAIVQQTLQQLRESVCERLDRADRSRHSATNLTRHNPAFVGRVRELTELRNALTRNRLGLVGTREGQQPGRATVQGLGGMGKTELALAYAHCFAWDYPGGRWQIPCEHLSDLRVALLHLAEVCNLQFTEYEKGNIAFAFERLLQELNRRERYLLILDNVSDPDLLQPDHMDRLPRDGRVDLVATTRLAPDTIPGSAADQTFIAVDELPEDDAIALMSSHQPEGRFASQEEHDEARAIVRLLRGFTIAVETAAIYIGRDTKEGACRRFRERLSPDLLRESDAAATDRTVAIRHRVRSLEETLAFTLQTLTPAALHVLSIASLLPAEQISLPWLKAIGTGKFSEFDETDRPDSSFRQAVELLSGLRLFQSSGVVDSDGNLLVVRMHRLVQELVTQNSQEDTDELQQRLLKHALERTQRLAVTWRDSSSRWEIDVLNAFAQQTAGRASLDADCVALLNFLAMRLHDLGRYAEAEPLLQRAVTAAEHVFGKEDSRTIGIRSNLGLLLESLGSTAEALAIGKRAFEAAKQSLGETHDETLIAANNLALTFKSQGDYGRAAEMLKWVMDRQVETIGLEHASTARTANNYAGMVALLGDFNSARQIHSVALEIQERLLGADHEDTLATVNDLAFLFERCEDFASAEPLARRAAESRKRLLGEEHPSTIMSLDNLAVLLARQGDFQAAEAISRDVVAVSEQSLGPEHPQTLVSLGNLASFINQTGDTAEALSLQRRVAEAHQRSPGPDHPNTLMSLNNLAVTLDQSGQSEEAISIFRKTLAARERILGIDHPDTLVSAHNLACALTDDWTAAEAVSRRPLELLLRKSSDSQQVHPMLPAALGNYAAVLERHGVTKEDVASRLDNLTRQFGMQIDPRAIPGNDPEPIQEESQMSRGDSMDSNNPLSEIQAIEQLLQAAKSGDQSEIAAILTRLMKCRNCEASFNIQQGVEFQPDPDTLLRITCPACGTLLSGIGMR